MDFDVSSNMSNNRPASPHLLSFLLRTSHGSAEVQSQLSEVDESVLVGGRWVNGQQLHQAVSHEADTREGGGRGELAVANKFKIKFLCVCVCVCVCV